MLKNKLTREELVAALDDTADKHRNSIGKNPISDLMWEAAEFLNALPTEPTEVSPPAKRGPGRPKKED